MSPYCMASRNLEIDSSILMLIQKTKVFLKATNRRLKIDYLLATSTTECVNVKLKQRRTLVLCNRFAKNSNSHAKSARSSKRRLKKTPREGWESTYRNMRYAFLLKLAEKHGARYIVTGHTADDQVETILHRVIRGTGLRGLAGMPRSRSLSPSVSLLRPMLGLSRSMARDYLESLEIEWKNDSTNASAAFTRNRIRHDLLPLLERDFNPQVSTAVLRLSQLAGEAQEMVDGVIANTLAACRSLKSNDEIVLKIDELVAQPEFLIRELMIAIWRERGWPLQAMGLREWQSLAELLQEADPGGCELLDKIVFGVCRVQTQSRCGCF